MIGVLNIHGVIGLIPDIEGNPIEPNVSLTDVVTQVESQRDELEQLDVYIKSVGGSVEVGDAIFDYLDSVKRSGIVVNTHAENECMSIATKIFGVGDERIIYRGCDFMIHNPWLAGVSGDADEFQEVSKDLRKLENRLIKEYSNITGSSPDALRGLMKKDTFLSPEQAIDLGFATDIGTSTKVKEPKAARLKAVAYSNKLKTKKMSDNKETKSVLDAINGLGDKITALMTGKKAEPIEDPNNPVALKLTDVLGQILDFTEVKEEQQPEIGAMATVDGNPAEGEYIMTNGEVLTFEKGKLTAQKNVVEVLAALRAEVSEAITAKDAAENESAALNTSLEGIKTELDSIKVLAGKLPEEDKSPAPEKKKEPIAAEAKFTNEMKDNALAALRN